MKPNRASAAVGASSSGREVVAPIGLTSPASSAAFKHVEQSASTG